MGLVKYALKFRVSFYVLSVVILFLGVGAVVSMPKDVFPSVNIPVVTIIWTYTGLTTPEMEKRVTTYSEYSLSNNINGIKNIESQTMYGVSVIKVYFQPDVNLDLAIAQCVASVNWIRAVMPPGIQPPTVVRYYASSVPVIQLALSSDKSSEQQLFDYGLYRVRQVLTQLPGATLPIPFGGKQRQIMVDLDQQALQARGLTPMDVTTAVGTENVVVPSGLVKLGSTQYPVRLNSSPDAIEALSRIPVKIVNGAPVLLRDVAYVRDGFGVQQNIVRANGRRAVLQTILKNGNASTLSVVGLVKSMLPQIRAAAPPDMKFTPLFDQSVFVSHAVFDVVREGLIAATLTGLMILMFLGSWRSTLIVLISIPLAVLSSLALLAALGETINLMTLGGLALAVGVLVDDATVAIENTYRLFDEGKPFRQAVVEGAAGIAKPTLISTLTICTAFISVVFLTDMARFLFTPQALAVVFAMIASYVLADAGADPDRRDRARRAPRPVERANPAKSVRTSSCRVRTSIREIPQLLCRPAPCHPEPANRHRGGCGDDGRRRRYPDVLRRRRLFPADQRRADAAACTRPDRVAGGRDRAAVPGGRGRNPPRRPGARSRPDPRQHRHAGDQLQSFL
jgi:multidrug efflux pump subunit AcrB